MQYFPGGHVAVSPSTGAGAGQLAGGPGPGTEDAGKRQNSPYEKMPSRPRAGKPGGRDLGREDPASPPGTSGAASSSEAPAHTPQLPLAGENLPPASEEDSESDLEAGPGKGNADDDNCCTE